MGGAGRAGVCGRLVGMQCGRGRRTGRRHRQYEADQCSRRSGELDYAWRHICRTALFASRPDKPRKRLRARPCLVCRHGHGPRAGSDPVGDGRQTLRHQRMEQGLRLRCRDREGIVELRSPGTRRNRREGLLRCGQSRARRLGGHAFSRHAGRAAYRTRSQYRQSRLGKGHRRSVQKLHHNRRPARDRWQGADRQWRRRIRRTRLYCGL